jgi:hypothetical protein
VADAERTGPKPRSLIAKLKAGELAVSSTVYFSVLKDDYAAAIWAGVAVGDSFGGSMIVTTSTEPSKTPTTFTLDLSVIFKRAHILSMNLVKPSF